MNWSLSKLGLFERCPKKYEFKYIQNLKDPPGPAAGRGIALHANIEGHLKDGTSLDESLSMYSGFLGSIRTMEGSILPEHRLGLTRTWAPCDFDSPDVWWRGILDLAVVQPHRGFLYDWKTGKIYDDHDDQKDIYSAALLIHNPHLYEVRAIHVYLDLGKNREKTLHRDQVPDVQRRFSERVAKLESCTEFYPKPQYLCRYCNFSKANGGPCIF